MWQQKEIDSNNECENNRAQSTVTAMGCYCGPLSQIQTITLSAVDWKTIKEYRVHRVGENRRYRAPSRFRPYLYDKKYHMALYNVLTGTECYTSYTLIWHTLDYRGQSFQLTRERYLNIIFFGSGFKRYLLEIGQNVCLKPQIFKRSSQKFSLI